MTFNWIILALVRNECGREYQTVTPQKLVVKMTKKCVDNVNGMLSLQDRNLFCSIEFFIILIMWSLCDRKRSRSEMDKRMKEMSFL